MVKKIKKILCALLMIAILLIFEILPIVYHVYAVDNVSGDYEYKLDEEKSSIKDEVQEAQKIFTKNKGKEKL